VLILDVDFSEKLKLVLSDPDAMAKITALASGLGKTAAPEAPSAVEPTSDVAASSDKTNLLLPSAQNGDPRINLLASLKPLLREDRRDRVDALTQALTLAAMMKNFRK
jgi:hypothetical protein